MEEIFTRRLHLPKFRHKMAKTKKFPQVRYTETLCTLNNTSKWISFKQTEIKNTYKNMMVDMYIPEPETMYKNITIQYRLIRHNKQKLDKDNIVWALKWIADAMESMGYIADDKDINFHSFDTIIDSSLPETMFEVRVMNDSQKW